MRKIIRYLSIFTAFCALLSLTSCYIDLRQGMEKTTEGQTNIQTEEPRITGIKFSSYAMLDLTLKKDEKYSSYFEIEGNADCDVDDFVVVGSNQNAAALEFDHKAVTNHNTIYIYYKITAISTGYESLYIQTKDGSVRSEEITVIVNDPEYTYVEQFLLKAGVKGTYGKLLTYNKGTAFEEKLYAHYIPAGLYLLYNPGISRTLVNVFSDETHLNDNNVEEPIDAFSIMLGIGETKEFIIPQGYHIELADQTSVFMSKIQLL